MILYKLTGLFIVFTIAVFVVLLLYYGANPKIYKAHLNSKKFDLITFFGFCVLISIFLMLISGARFIILL